MSPRKPKFYLTTPIYYTNGLPHIGHTYTTVVADTIRRYKRMRGYEVVMATGTDEHGVNVERAAKKAGVSETAFVAKMATEWRALWDELGLTADEFVRTTDLHHVRTVQWLFRLCRENGYVYKGHYTGQYCIYDNAFVNDAKPGDNCPDCGRPTETVTEENYFFKLSAFHKPLLDFYKKNPEFIQPESRRNEIVSFVEGGLKDLSITRTTIRWGIPVPGEEPHVFYVWFDALTAYLSAVGGPEFEKRGMWPADLHLVGKDIIRFKRLLAGVLNGCDAAAAEASLGAWLVFDGRGENEQIQGKRGAATADRQRAGYGRIALFPAARSRVRPGR